MILRELSGQKLSDRLRQVERDAQHSHPTVEAMLLEGREAEDHSLGQVKLFQIGAEPAEMGLLDREGGFALARDLRSPQPKDEIDLESRG